MASEISIWINRATGYRIRIDMRLVRLANWTCSNIAERLASLDAFEFRFSADSVNSFRLKSLPVMGNNFTAYKTRDIDAMYLGLFISPWFSYHFSCYHPADYA